MSGACDPGGWVRRREPAPTLIPQDLHHAALKLVTGPVTAAMRAALLATYRAVPAPKLVIACGACAISGCPFAGHPEVHDGIGELLSVDLFVPGCPPHPYTLLDGLLRLIGRRGESRGAAAAARQRSWQTGVRSRTPPTISQGD